MVVGGAVYWLLFAWAHTMIVYYPTSVYPLLHATGEPNPDFFISTASPFAFYFSGMEYFPTGHLLLMFLVGDTVFSFLISAFVMLNASMIYRYLSAGIQKEYRPIVFLMLAAFIVSAVSPLGTLLVMGLNPLHTFKFLEIFTESYSYVTDPSSALVLGLMIPMWRKLLHFHTLQQSEHRTERFYSF